MKPTAATVLPAPVACSNQKRRSAPGSSGASSTTSSSSAAAPPSPGAPRRGRAPRPPRLVGGRLAPPARPRPLEPRRRRRRRPLRRSFGRAACCSAISSVSVPESASTWCGFSSAPSRSFGGSSASSRSSPSSREKSRRHWIEGASAPSSSSFSAASRARRRAVPGASASGPSPSSRNGSRANSAARSISALEGTAARAATSLVLAMKACGSAPSRDARRAAGTSWTRMPGVRFPSPRRSQRPAYRADRTVRIVITEIGCLRDCKPALAGSHRPQRAALAVAGCGSSAAAATTAASTPTTRRRWPALRRRWPRCTPRRTGCSRAASPPSKSGSRRCGATRWWSTSGPPGAGPAASSSPSSSSLAARYGRRRRLPRRRLPGLERRRPHLPSEAPVPYPSYTDPHKQIAAALGASLGLPDTAFYDRRGKLVYLKQGPYANPAELEADVERYALEGRIIGLMESLRRSSP